MLGGIQQNNQHLKRSHSQQHLCLNTSDPGQGTLLVLSYSWNPLTSILGNASDDATPADI